MKDDDDEKIADLAKQLRSNLSSDDVADNLLNDGLKELQKVVIHQIGVIIKSAEAGADDYEKEKQGVARQAVRIENLLNIDEGLPITKGAKLGGLLIATAAYIDFVLDDIDTDELNALKEVIREAKEKRDLAESGKTATKH